MSKNDEPRERVAFNYYYAHDKEATNVSVSFTPTDLNDVANKFKDFLLGMTYSYVDKVVIVKNNKDEVVSD